MPAGAKRFYEAAAVAEAEGGFAVTLDGLPIKTPAGAGLIVPTRGLAQAVADEWAAQGEFIEPAAMPLTGLANTAIDRAAGQWRAMVGEIQRFAGTDLLCYRAEAPPDLVARQTAGWQPLLDWAAEVYGARLAVTAGVVPISQPWDALTALGVAVEALDDVQLTVLGCATAATGSLVVGLALVAGRIDADEASAASQLDEAFQSEFWGEDAEAVARLGRLGDDIRAAAKFLKLAKT